MARRPRGWQRPASPRARRGVGWLAALGAVVVVALAVRLVGGADAPGSTSPTQGSGADASRIVFGTALEPGSGAIREQVRTTRFTPGETFAYAAPEMSVTTTVYVAVERLDEPNELVQPPSPQDLPAGAPAVAFSVPVDALLAAFGPGRYEMRIYLDPDARPAAVGTFTLVAPISSPGD